MLWLQRLTDLIYGVPLTAALLGVGLYFTVRTHAVQVRGLRKGLRALKNGGNLRAMLISTGARVGTGNIAGVAVAIAIGGPGAAFWMWIMALIGAASAFAESVLAQKYRRRSREGWVGGAAFYMRYGLRSRGMGIAFTAALIVCFGGAMNALQAFQMQSAMTAYGVPPLVTAAAVTVLTALCIRRDSVGRWSEILVPVMTVGYLLLTLLVMALRWERIPAVLTEILHSAFAPESFSGGLSGSALSIGIRRGLFTNEAGMGSASQAAASADAKRPADQGMAQVLSVFIDTLILCSATVFLLLLSDAAPTGMNSIVWVQAAVTEVLGGWAGYIVSASVICFAFTSVLGGYYYADSAARYFGNAPRLRLCIRLFCLLTVFFGSLAQAEPVWQLTDLCMAIMASLNLIALWRLRHEVTDSLRDWRVMPAPYSAAPAGSRWPPRN